MSGDFSSYLESYWSDRPINRRPPTTYRFSLNTTSSFSFLTLGIGLFYTSEDRFTAQRVNRFNLKPQWKWGAIDIGDFSPSFTEYTLAGFSVRGGQLRLFPKVFRFTVLGGESKRADTVNNTYKRNLIGLRLGTTFFTINVLKVKDDINSLPKEDTARPEENLVGGIETNFSLFRVLTFSLEGTGSLHTRDLRSDTIQHQRIPEFIYRIYQPRRSSRVDFAIRNGLKLNLRLFTIDFSFGQVGAGYTSLGVPYLKNDCRRFRGAINTKVVPKTTVDFSLEQEYDNLTQDKLATTKTRGVGISLRFTPNQRLSLNTNFNQKQQRKDASGDSFKIHNTIRWINISPCYTFKVFQMPTNSTLMFFYQEFKNFLPLTRLPSTQTITFALNNSISPRPNITITLSFNHIRSILSQERKGQNSLVISGTHRGWSNRLTSSLIFNYSPGNTGKNIRISGKSGFNFTKNDILSLEWGFGFFFARGEESFSERQVSLTYTRRLF
ncbi:MAG: hypothetical protein ABIK39_01780 [candidate division WOR-3 bacterium]